MSYLAVEVQLPTHYAQPEHEGIVIARANSIEDAKTAALAIYNKRMADAASEDRTPRDHMPEFDTFAELLQFLFEHDARIYIVSA